MECTDDSFSSDKVNVEHQAEDIGNAGHNISVTECERFEITLILFCAFEFESFIIDIFSEEKNSTLVYIEQGEFRPAVKGVVLPENRYLDNRLFFYEIEDIFFCKCRKEFFLVCWMDIVFGTNRQQILKGFEGGVCG